MRILIFCDEETEEIWYYILEDDAPFPFAVDGDIIKIIKKDKEGDDYNGPVIH